MAKVSHRSGESTAGAGLVEKLLDWAVEDVDTEHVQPKVDAAAQREGEAESSIFE